MNILITVSVRWWNANAYYAISVAEALNQLGHQVFVAGDPGYPPTIEAENRGLHTVPICFSSLNPFVFIRDMFRLSRFIKRNQIEIINAHRPEDHLWTALLARRLKIPLVRTVGDVRSPRDNFFNHWLHFKRSDYFILSSESIFIRYHSVWPEFTDNFSILPGGVDGKLFYANGKNPKLRETLQIPDDTYVVGIVARLSPIKDHLSFIIAAPLVLDRVPNVIFLVSGSEEEVLVNDLKSLARNLNILDHFRFLDRYSPVRDLISLFDVGVVASKGSEVIARIAMEYIATGIPVVATDINVLPEVVINNRNGFIISPGDSYEMAEAISKLLENDDLRNQIFQVNQEDFKNKFDILLVAKSITTIYENTLKRFKNKSN